MWLTLPHSNLHKRSLHMNVQSLLPRDKVVGLEIFLLLDISLTSYFSSFGHPRVDRVW